MHVGCQRGDVTEEELQFKARHGVYHIDGRAPKMIDGVGWDIADARRRNEMAAECGISIDAYHLPLTSAGIDRVKVPHIMLGKDPERDREIEMIQQMRRHLFFAGSGKGSRPKQGADARWNSGQGHGL